jgi:hypothetical protein
MKLLLEIRDDKFEFIMELLRNFSFVKAKPIHSEADFDTSITREPDATYNENAISENIKTGIKEVRLFKKGKLKTTPAKDFLNEL